MKRILRFFLPLVVLACVTLSTSNVYAADGSGAMVVSPTTANASSTGNTHTFTYTASETMDSGEVTVTAPSGWTAPQGTSGTAGYTTASSTGTIADVINPLNSTSGWSAPNHQDFTVDATSPQEGTGSLLIKVPANMVAGEQTYVNYGSAQNWGGINSASSNLRVGLFLKSSVATAAGDIQWLDDDSANLASPLDTVNIPALTANTWTYVSLTLGATTRTSILSYGFKFAVNKGAMTLNVDAMGPMFDAGGANNWTGDTGVTVAVNSSGQKEGSSSVRCTYAASAGVGTNGDCYQSNATAITQGPGTQLGMWVFPSVALNAGDFAWVDDGNTALASPEDQVNLPAMPANTWTYVSIVVPNSSNKATHSFGIRQLVDKGAMTIDLDAMIKITNTGDTTTGWTAQTIQTLSADTTTTHEGGTSLRDDLTAAATAGEKWYQTFGSAQNWSSYTTGGFWIRSSVATAAGNLQFAYASTSDLSSPIATINIPALTANTWTYVKPALTGTRTSVLSYGIIYATDIGAASIYLDDVLMGPGVPTFSGTDMKVRLLGLSSGQTVTFTYGSGGGTSGATAPATTGAYTFTTKSRISDAGTLTNLATSPVITVNSVTPPTVTGVTSSTTNGSYKAGQVISVQVTFDQAVTVTGTPQLTLSTGSPATTAINYVSGSGSNTLTFTYTVASGNTSADLDYASTTALGLNGGTIKNAGGTNATLTLAAPAAAGSLGANKNIVIDTTVPTVGQVTVVPTPTNSTTPSYTFSSTEGGTITYGGSCSSSTTTATAGNNTITFNTLTPGTYSNCTITVTDAAGNVSSTLTVNTFTIDTTAPTVTQVTAVPSPTNNTAPSYTFNTTEAGTITYGGSCSSATTTATAGNNTITFNSLAAGTYSNCTIKVTDAAGNQSTVLTVNTFTIDTTAPTVTQVTAVSTPTNTHTPSYTFNTTEAGTITYGGSCSSATTTATAGNNTITFNSLVDGTYSNCTIKVTDAAGNQSTLLTVNSFTIDSVAPTVTNVTSTTANGSYKAGQVIPVTITFSENVTVTGTPQLTLSTGSPATTLVNYSSGSGTNILTFNYTVAAGNTTADLDYASTAALILNSGTIKDAAGNNATLTLAAPAAAGSLGANKNIVIDTTAPTVAQVTPVPTPTNSTTPSYTFSSTEGGTITYGGSCSSANTTATAGNNTVTFNSLTAGTYSNCTITVTDAAGNVSSTLTINTFTIDTTAPTVSGVTATNANGSYKAGQVIHVTVNFGENVTVTGTPQITLSTGSPATTLVNYVSGSGTSTLTFDYTVAAGNTSADLDYASTAALILNSGTIKDAAGNNAVLTLATPGAANSLGGNKNIVIDTTAPTIAQVTAVPSPANSTTPSYTFSSSEAGTITYGGDCSSATTSAISGNNTITFNTLSAGAHTNCTITVTDTAGNISTVLNVNSFTIDTTAPVLTQVTAVPTPSSNTAPSYTFNTTEAGTITYGGDCSSATTTATSGNNTITFNTLASGTHSNCTIRVTDAAGNISSVLNVNTFVIDTTAPVLAQVTAVPTLTNSTTPSYTFSSTEAGTITYGGDCSSATTSAVAGNNTITFNTLSAGTHSNCTIKVTDAAGNQSTVLNVNSFTIDTTAPVIAQVTAVPTPSNNTTPSYTFSSTEAATITYGGSCSSATTSAIAGNNTITFNTLTPGTYSNCTIKVTDSAGNQSTVLSVNTFVIDTTAPVLAQVTAVPTPTNNTTPSYTFSSTEAGTITYGGDCSSSTTAATVGNNTITFNTLSEGTHSNCTIRITDAAGNQSTVLNVNPFIIDATAPTVTSVSATNTNATYGAGSVIHVTVGFSESVTVVGTPTLSLSTGSPAVTAVAYVSGSGTSTLTFDYTVAAGNNSADLDYASTTALLLAGGTIKDAAGNNAVLTLAAPGATNSLGANKNIVIDTTAPVLAQVTAVPTPTNNTTPSYTFSSTEAGTITYGGDCSSSTTEATVGNNAITFNTLSAGTHSNCTIKVTDAAGNQSTLLSVNTFVIDTSIPSVTGVTSSNINGSYKAGDVIHVQVGFSQNVTVTGTPQISLSTGSPVTTLVNYVSGSGTSTLTFDYTVVAGNNSADLDYASIAALVLNGGIIRNTSLTNAVLTLAAPGFPGSLGDSKNIVIDTTAPTLVQVTAVPTPTNNTTPSYTFSSTEAGTITYGGDCSSSTTEATVGNNAITFNTLSAAAHTNCTITVTDAAGNISTVLNVNSFTIDTTTPTVALTSPVSGSTNTSPVSFTATFSESVTGFTLSDIQVTNGTAQNLSGGPFIYTFQVVPSANGTVQVSIPSSAADDLAGNHSQVSNTYSFTYNNTTPTATLSTTAPTSTKTSPMPFTLTFSTDVTGLDLTDIQVTNGTAQNLSGGPSVYTFEVVPSGNGSVTIGVSAGAAQDAFGNQNSASNQITRNYDTTAPTLAQVTAVPTPTNNTTPSYTFSSTEAGTITYGGDCSSTTTSAVAGNNTITFTTLASGIHSNCTIQLTDAAGNQSTLLSVNSFVIDLSVPVLTEIVPVPTPSNNTNPSYTFNSDQAGTITYSGDCSSLTTTAVVGDNTVTFNALSAGIHANCKIRITNASGSSSADLNVSSFVIDLTAPVLTQVTPIPTPTNNTTPSYTFSSTEAGTITYGGDCSSTTTTATAGNNTVTFNTLVDGTYSNCTIKVTDAAGNVSATLAIPAFTIDTSSFTAQISSSVVSPTNTSPVTVTITFNKATTDFDLTDLQVTNGATQNLSGGPSVYTFEVVPSANGTVTISIPAASAHDQAGNSNVVSNVFSFDYNTVQPSANLTTTASLVTKTSPLPFTLTFSTDVTGLDLSDIQVTNGTAQNLSGGPSVYTFEVVPSGEGTVSVYVTAGAAQDSATNQSTASNQVNRTFDTTAPVLNEVTSVPTPSNNTTPSYTFSSTEAGTITYGGDCSSTTTSATVGNNTITFNALANGIHSNCTITVTDAAGNVSSVLNVHTFKIDTDLPVTQYTIDDRTSMTVGTRLAYTVTRINASANPVSSGSNTVYLYSNSTSANKKFYDSASGGSVITSLTIPDGVSSKNFWYFDDQVGSVRVTAGDSSSGPDAIPDTNGVVDAYDDILVNSVPTFATKFVMEIPNTSALTGSIIPVTIKAVGTDSTTIDTNYNGAVTLSTSGAATPGNGGVLVIITNGIGSVNITDTQAEVVAITLSDTQATGFDVSNTKSIEFRSPVTENNSVSGQSPAPTPAPEFTSSPTPQNSEVITPHIEISGRAYPASHVRIFGISSDSKQVPLEENGVEGAKGDFGISFNDKMQSYKKVGILSIDKDLRASLARIFDLNTTDDSLVVKNFTFPPTIDILRSILRQGDNLKVYGYGYANAKLELELDNKIVNKTITTDKDGYYELLLPTTNLKLGAHQIRVREVGHEFSPTKGFTLTKLFLPEADLNMNGKIDAGDLSIFSSRRLDTRPEVRKTVDFNKDGKVDAKDLSILLSSGQL